MSTSSLMALMEGWEGEAMMRDIPVRLIQMELHHRGVEMLKLWCGDNP